MSTDSRGLDVDHRADAGREACEPPGLRRHDDYRAPRWATAHVDGVDKLFAAASDTGTLSRGDPRVRIDVDGVGSESASLHDTGENVNLSVWITPEQAHELIELLQDAIKDGANRWWVDCGGEHDA